MYCMYKNIGNTTEGIVGGRGSAAYLHGNIGNIHTYMEHRVSWSCICIFYHFFLSLKHSFIFVVHSLWKFQFSILINALCCVMAWIMYDMSWWCRHIALHCSLRTVSNRIWGDAVWPALVWPLTWTPAPSPAAARRGSGRSWASRAGTPRRWSGGRGTGRGRGCSPPCCCSARTGCGSGHGAGAAATDLS